MCPLFRGSTVHKEEDNLSIVDKMAGPFISIFLFSLPIIRMHTVVVESGTGDIYSFGLASNGQLGSGERKNLLEPTLIQLGEPPATNIGPPDVGSDPSSEGDESTKFKYSLRRVFAGGDQTFASVRLVEVDKDDVSWS